ncbi:lonely Cys domain-containing protein [Streptomyces fumanus]|uniref:lonely Cys domain-containing protein n=1 Tax=Streptomyces fumanus TaxID=67302 RepID=UPI00332FFCA0
MINVLAWNLGIASEDLPRFGGIQVDSALSWIDPPDRPAEETAVPGRADTLRVAQMVVQTLVRDLHNRQGDLHLTQVAPVVSRHPQPDLLWEAVLRFLADRPEFASRVVAVTDRREEPEGEVRVELPPAARELLHIDTETADDQQMHWLGEYLTPAALRPAPAPEQGAGEPTAAAPAQEPPAAGLRVPESVTPSANAVPKALWEHRRAGAVPARLRTEIYDPSSAPDRGGDRPHLLAGEATYVRAEIRRVQAEDGRWVRDLTVVLPVRLGTGMDTGALVALQERMTRLLDDHLNTGFVLPVSGDQMHVGVELVVAPQDQEAVELTVSPRPAGSDQFHFNLRAEDGGPEDAVNNGVLLHELLHYIGVTDRAFDPTALFRNHPRKAFGSGVMADVSAPLGTSLPQDYLAQIETATSSGPVVRDHPLGAPPAPPTPLTPPAPTRTDAAPYLTDGTHRTDGTPEFPPSRAPGVGAEPGPSADPGPGRPAGSSTVPVPGNADPAAGDTAIVENWLAESDSPRARRSPALRSVDAAVRTWVEGGRNLPGNHDLNRRQLGAILRATAEWKAAKGGRSSRMSAVDRLRAHVRAVLHAVEADSRAVADRLEALRLGDPELRDGTPDADAVVRRVLRLDAGASVSEAQRQELFELTWRAMRVDGGGRANSLAELSVFRLGDAPFAPGARLWGPRGRSGGLNWSVTPVRSVATDRTRVFAPDGRGGLMQTSDDAAPWEAPGGPAPFVVVAEGGHDHVWVPGPGGPWARLSVAEFVELLARDPELAGLPADVPVVLVVPDAGGQGLDLPRALADRLGRTVWSASGEARLGPGGTRDEGTIALLDRGRERPLGRWIPSLPGLRPSAGGVVTALDGTVFHDSDVYTRTIVTDGLTTGRSLIGNDDQVWETGESRLPQATKIFHVVPLEPKPAVAEQDLRPDIRSAVRYYLSMHGFPGRSVMPMRSGQSKHVSGPEFGRFLKRRPSVAALPADAVIHMMSCWSAAATDAPDGLDGAGNHAPDPFVSDPLATVAVGQHVANETRKRVLAFSRVNGFRLSPAMRTMYTTPDGRPGAVVLFVPEPTAAELDGLARVAGLHGGAGPVPEEVRGRTLRLVRALRLTFGTDVEADRDVPGGAYQELLRGIGALEVMRANDPVLGPVTPFTLGLLRHAVARGRQAGGPGAGPDAAAYRALLERSRDAVAADPGTTLSAFTPLPWLDRAAHELSRSADVTSLARDVLRLDPSAPVGPGEVARLYWAVVRAFEVLGTADVAALAIRVLHLDASAQVDEGMRQRLLWRVAGAAAAGREVSDPAALAAFDLEVRGALEPRTLVVDAKGVAQGRTWTGQQVARVNTSRVEERDPLGGSGMKPRRVVPPWAGPGLPVPWILHAHTVGGAVSIRWPDGSATVVPDDEVVQLLAHDPALTAVPLEHPIALIVPNAADGSLPGAISTGQGRHVWSHDAAVDLTGNGSPTQHTIVVSSRLDQSPAEFWTQSVPRRVQIGPLASAPQPPMAERALTLAPEATDPSSAALTPVPLADRSALPGPVSPSPAPTVVTRSTASPAPYEHVLPGAYPDSEPGPDPGLAMASESESDAMSVGTATSPPAEPSPEPAPAVPSRGELVFAALTLDAAAGPGAGDSGGAAGRERAGDPRWSLLQELLGPELADDPDAARYVRAVEALERVRPATGRTGPGPLSVPELDALMVRVLRLDPDVDVTAEQYRALLHLVLDAMTAGFAGSPAALEAFCLWSTGSGLPDVDVPGRR